MNSSSAIYEVAVLESATDPNPLCDLELALRDFGILHSGEVDEFAEVLLKPVNEPGDPGLLNSIVDKAVQRFKEADEEAQETFRKTLGQCQRGRRKPPIRA